MDETDGSSALASDNQGVGLIIFIAPADTALNLVLRGVVNVLCTLDLHSFTKLLLIELLL